LSIDSGKYLNKTRVLPVFVNTDAFGCGNFPQLVDKILFQ
jgi:hypothetical protein